MLPKKIRLTTSLFDQVYKLGRVKHSRLFLVRSHTAIEDITSLFAVSVPKKFAKTAVLRNKIKRIVYRAIQEALSDFSIKIPSQKTIFGVKIDISGVAFEEVVKEVKDLLLLSSSPGSTPVEKRPKIS